MRGTDPDRRLQPTRGRFRQRGSAIARTSSASLAADHLEVIVGDIGEPNLGLDQATWEPLAQRVDLIVHPAALVNHVLPYDQLFGPNVVGTAELIRLAITTRIKPVTYLSTVAVAMSVDPAKFAEDGDIRDDQPGASRRRQLRQRIRRTASGAARCCFARRTTCAACRSRCSAPT